MTILHLPTENSVYPNVTITTENINPNSVAFDNTKLGAINTCPRWGLIRYNEHRVMSTNNRAMALEAGSACHEFFAAVRLLTLLYMGLDKHFAYHGERLFGKDRFLTMITHMGDSGIFMTNTQAQLSFCLEALYTSGFYDDPNERKRTMSNLEAACIAYFDRWDFGREKIWVMDVNDHTQPVGIEMAFELGIKFNWPDHHFKPLEDHEYRFTGKIDGVSLKDGQICVDENKTASRMDDAWRMSFDMAHQVTGYIVAGALLTHTDLLEHNSAIVRGLQIPLPKNDSGVLKLNVSRTSSAIIDWGRWLYHTIELSEQYKESPTDAPAYTHSCNRYFSPCSYLALCTADSKDRKEIMENEMEVKEWSPLHE